MKRLAFLLPDMSGGGAERVALRLIADFVARGHEVDLVLVKAEGELLPVVPQGVRIFDLGASRLRSALIPLVRYFRDRRPHAIQISMWPLTIVGIIAARLARTGTRVVTSDHVVLTRQYGTSGRVFRAMRWTIRTFYPWAAARILVSRQSADDLAAFSGLDRESLEAIYNPVDSPPVASADQTGGPTWPEGAARLLTVGKLKDQKNHRLLIRAFRLLVERRPATLMIVGEGPLGRELRDYAREQGVADKVVFAGFTVDPWPYFRSADLFVLSSDYEGYPLVLLEAMRCGLPVVSTDCESGPREILDDGRYGPLVPVGDPEALAGAIEQALDRPAEPESLRARAEALSGQDTSDRYLSLMLGEAG
jgi:glycosyltransferase involved in cell wall biosynthesis